MFCLPQSNPAPAIVYGQCLLFAVVVLSYFTASEKENLRPEGKQNCVIKNEKRKKKLWLLLLEQQKNDRSSLFFSSKLAGLL